MTKILVTGAAGFVGSHLVDFLLENKVKPKDIRLLIAPWDGVKNLPKAKLEIIKGDIRDKKLVKKIVSNVDVIFHLAAKTITPDAVDGYYDDTNYLGTKNLLEALKGKKIKKFVYFSSISVFGLPAWKGDMENADEGWPKKPSEPYGTSKLKAEEELIKYAQRLSLPYVIIRPTTVYGPRDKAGIYQLMIAIKKGLFFYVGSGQNKMDYVYVKDLVRVAVDAANSKYKDEDFIIGSGDYATQKEIVNEACSALGVKKPTIYLNKYLVLFLSYIVEKFCRLTNVTPLLFPQRVRVLISSCYFNTEKAKKMLNYKPYYSLNKGLKETAEWFEKTNFYEKQK